MGPLGQDILLIRHAIAEERTPERPDESRALTHAGRDRARRVFERLVALGFADGNHLLSSPLIRARQTAEIAVEAGLAAELQLTEGLAPGQDPFSSLLAWRRSANQERGGRLLLVGHEPDLGLLACRMIGAPEGAITLKKAGVAWLRLPDDRLGEGSGEGGGQLKLLLSPKALLPLSSSDH